MNVFLEALVEASAHHVKLIFQDSATEVAALYVRDASQLLPLVHRRKHVGDLIAHPARGRESANLYSKIMQDKCPKHLHGT